MKEQEWEVEAILDWRVVGGETEYLIKWKDYPPEESTWEHESCLKKSQKLLKEFKKAQKEKEEEAKRKRAAERLEKRRKVEELLERQAERKRRAQRPIKEPNEVQKQFCLDFADCIFIDPVIVARNKAKDEELQRLVEEVEREKEEEEREKKEEEEAKKQSAAKKKERVSNVARTPKNIKQELGVESKSRRRPNQGVDDVVKRSVARRIDEPAVAEKKNGTIVKVTEDNKDCFLWKVPPVAADERGAREEKVLLKQLDFEGAEVVGHRVHEGQRFYATKFMDGAKLFVHDTIAKDKARDAVFAYLEDKVIGKEPINANVT